MDTSETYIKMCDCEEIQEQCKYAEGDVVHDGDGIEVIGSILTVGTHQATKGGYDYDFFDYEWSRAIWLPRQDQLQKMSGFDWRSFDKKCLVYERSVLVPTKEQAGIRVVMKEKYNKIWDGKDWGTKKF